MPRSGSPGCRRSTTSSGWRPRRTRTRSGARPICPGPGSPTPTSAWAASSTSGTIWTPPGSEARRALGLLASFRTRIDRRPASSCSPTSSWPRAISRRRPASWPRPNVRCTSTTSSAKHPGWRPPARRSPSAQATWTGRRGSPRSSTCRWSALESVWRGEMLTPRCPRSIHIAVRLSRGRGSTIG